MYIIWTSQIIHNSLLGPNENKCSLFGERTLLACNEQVCRQFTLEMG